MSPDDFRAWGEVFRDLGGWGMSVVFLLLFINEQRKNAVKDNRTFGYLESSNRALQAIIRLGSSEPGAPMLSPPEEGEHRDP